MGWKDREYRLSYYRNRYKKNKARLQREAKMRARSNANKRRMTVYGMTETQYDEMVAAQAGLCAICTEPMNPYSGTNVDHCHSTGKVRGLLCDRCNRGLGQLKDDPFTVHSALAYLEVHLG